MLFSPKFSWLFLTQFFGAFNDNLVRLTVTLAITYSPLFAGMNAGLAINLLAALFILPFMFLSASAGLGADHFDMTRLMRYVKLAEVGIVVLVFTGLLMGYAALLFLGVFLLGMHSAVFGPAKYAYLPHHLPSSQLLSANAAIEAATFVAILGGVLVAGSLFHWQGSLLGAQLAIVIALVGWACSYRMPLTPPVAFLPKDTEAYSLIRFSLIPSFRHTRDSLRLAWQIPPLKRALLLISWLWFIGVIFLTHFTLLAEQTFQAKAACATVLLGLFALGVSLGAGTVAVVYQGKINLRASQIGLLLLVLAGLDMLWSSSHLVNTAEITALSGLTPDAVGVWDVLTYSANLHFVLDLLLASIGGGVFSVPLYTQMQALAPKHKRAQIVAANNVLNAVFMIVATGGAAVALMLGLSIPLLLAATCIACVIPLLFLPFKQRGHWHVPVITIDGPSASGKGTVAAQLAHDLGFHYLDSGALYRVTAYVAQQKGLPLELSYASEIASLARQMEVSFGAQGQVFWRNPERNQVVDIDADIRTEVMGIGASLVSAFPQVRQALMQRFRGFAQVPGLVADGRDMGTVVFPQAKLKVFLTADAKVRAQRRCLQLQQAQNSVPVADSVNHKAKKDTIAPPPRADVAAGMSDDVGQLYAKVLADLQQRDARDRQREEAPLRPAADARELCTDTLTVVQAVAQVRAWWNGVLLNT